MERVTAPSRSVLPRAGVALATCLGLVAGGLVLGPAPASASVDWPAVPRPVPHLTLAKVPGQPLREASRPVPGGRVDLRASFSQVAVTWRSGDLTALARAHGRDGWTAWEDLDRITGHTGVQGTDLIWMGPSDRVQVRVSGSGSATQVPVIVLQMGRPGVVQFALGIDATVVRAAPASEGALSNAQSLSVSRSR